jgi:hypothetical protein
METQLQRQEIFPKTFSQIILAVTLAMAFYSASVLKRDSRLFVRAPRY